MNEVYDPDVLADAEPEPTRALYHAQWAQLLQSDAGQGVAVELLRQCGIGSPVVSDLTRERHNFALELLADLYLAEPRAAAQVLARAMLGETPADQG